MSTVERKCATCIFARWQTPPTEHHGECMDESHPLRGWSHIYRAGNGEPPDDDTGRGCPAWKAQQTVLVVGDKVPEDVKVVPWERARWFTFKDDAELAEAMAEAREQEQKWHERWPQGFIEYRPRTGTVITDPVSGSEFVRFPHHWAIVDNLGMTLPFGHGTKQGGPQLFSDVLLDPRYNMEHGMESVALAVAWNVPEMVETLDRCCRAIREATKGFAMTHARGGQ